MQGSFALNFGTFRALKTGQNGQVYECEVYECEAYEALREKQAGPTAALADDGTTCGSGVRSRKKHPAPRASGPVKTTGHDHANRTAEHH